MNITRQRGSSCVSLAASAAMLLSAVSVASAGQEHRLTVGGQIRVRSEVDARNFETSKQPDAAVSARVRLQVTAEPVPGVTAYIQMQDVRMWGESRHTLTDADADGLDMHQGYIKTQDLWRTGLTLYAGRQEVNFGEQRLVGAVGWTQNARSFDGLLARYAWNEQYSVQPFAFLLHERDAVAAGGALRQLDPNAQEGRNDDAWFAGSHAVARLSPHVTLEPHLYFLKDGRTDVERLTLGLYAHGRTPLTAEVDTVYNGTYDYQIGSVRSAEAPDLDIAAFLVTGHIGLAYRGAMATIGYEYLSGDDDPNDATVQNFNTLFGTNHKFYGHMDYFLNNRADTAGLGLQDLVAQFRAPLIPQVGMGVDLHWLLTAVEDKNQYGGAETFGQELDTWITYTHSNKLGIRAGYSGFVPGQAISERFRATDPTSRHAAVAHWAYAMIDLKW